MALRCAHRIIPIKPMRCKITNAFKITINMKTILRILIAVAFYGSLTTFNSCSGAQLRTHAGIDVNWGPNGPRVRPHIGVDVYNGGRHH